MNRVLIAITTRTGTPPTRVREQAEEALRRAENAGHAATLRIPEDNYSVAFCRNQAVHECIQGSYSHLWFIDDDVYVPPNALVELLAMKQKVSAGVYASIKTENIGDLKAQTYIVAGKDGQWFRNWFKGIRSVDVVGAGCLLLERSVFTAVKFPWFRWPEGIVDGKHIWKSDDLDFCERCIAAGIGVYVNGDVRCGHVKPVDIANFVSEEP
jgi:hypothetical protein